MINAIGHAFYEASVLLEHRAGDTEDDGGEVLTIDGWLVRPVG